MAVSSSSLQQSDRQRKEPRTPKSRRCTTL